MPGVRVQRQRRARGAPPGISVCRISGLVGRGDCASCLVAGGVARRGGLRRDWRYGRWSREDSLPSQGTELGGRGSWSPRSPSSGQRGATCLASPSAPLYHSQITSAQNLRQAPRPTRDRPAPSAAPRRLINEVARSRQPFSSSVT
jgi:hypothetical protein